eukprot:scaffold8694_cov135-Cylindrotheca_fusiformis.AAC.2
MVFLLGLHHRYMNGSLDLWKRTRGRIKIQIKSSTHYASFDVVARDARDARESVATRMVAGLIIVFHQAMRLGTHCGIGQISPWNVVKTGDCDSDNDCESGLICFQRGAYESVPGCSGGSSDGSLSDYCIFE